MSEPATERLEAWEEEQCLLCAPALHENCEKYTVLLMCDPEPVPLGEDYGDHMVEIPVCYEHHEAFTKYRKGANVEEATPW